MDGSGTNRRSTPLPRSRLNLPNNIPPREIDANVDTEGSGMGSSQWQQVDHDMADYNYQAMDSAHEYQTVIPPYRQPALLGIQNELSPMSDAPSDGLSPQGASEYQRTGFEQHVAAASSTGRDHSIGSNSHSEEKKRKRKYGQGIVNRWTMPGEEHTPRIRQLQSHFGGQFLQTVEVYNSYYKRLRQDQASNDVQLAADVLLVSALLGGTTEQKEEAATTIHDRAEQRRRGDSSGS